MCDREVGGCSTPTYPCVALGGEGRECGMCDVCGMFGEKNAQRREKEFSPGAQSKLKATKMAKAGHKVR